ncbi:CAP domain-containing protein [Mariniphaga sp.]|uniref:CAP domain-containing protein n=1 Tax=Mariniphaga sp. TaxID=1954475 RepID=UPI00356A8767
MKRKVNVLLLILTFALTGWISANDNGAGWNNAALNTASEAIYLSPLEKEIVLEINKLRSDPVRYATTYIAPLAKKYNRRLLYYPGDLPLLTREGVNALYECVRDLKKQQPLPIIYPSEGLTLAARDHVSDQSKTGRTGHQGSDRSTMRDRVERYGKWEKRIAENIAYGGKTAQQIVIYLLIDDGVRDRGHRKNFLNPDFNVVGVATGNHPQYNLMSVMDFAGGFKKTEK